MSGRIRTLKPEILEDERTAHLSHASYRLFIGLILVADDYGNFRANPDQLRGAIFWGAPPDDPRTSEAGGIDALLADLARVEDDGSPGLITLYRVKGQRYGHLNGWSKNQKVQKPGAPRVPGPKEGENVVLPTDSGRPPESFQNASGGTPGDPKPDHRSPITDHDQRSTITAAPVVPALVLDGSVPKKPTKRTPTKTTCPTDWTPSEDTLTVLAGEGIDRLVALAIVREFLEYWVYGDGAGKRKASWDMTFRTRARMLRDGNRLPPAIEEPPRPRPPEPKRDVVTDPAELARIRAEIDRNLADVRRKQAPFLFDDEPKKPASQPQEKSP